MARPAELGTTAADSRAGPQDWRAPAGAHHSSTGGKLPSHLLEPSDPPNAAQLHMHFACSNVALGVVLLQGRSRVQDVLGTFSSDEEDHIGRLGHFGRPMTAQQRIFASGPMLGEESEDGELQLAHPVHRSHLNTWSNIYEVPPPPPPPKLPSSLLISSRLHCVPV